MTRRVTLERDTRETRIRLTLDLDGSGATAIATPIPFFSHMLDALCRHGNCDLALDVTGDVDVDHHHTVEDTGRMLGRAVRQALGDAVGIRRMGDAWVPMDEALGFAAVDLSGRPFCVFRGTFTRAPQGALELDTVPEFFRALALEARMALHLSVAAGENDHHKVEALFKACGRALAAAVERDPRRAGVVPSTKGVL